MSSSSNDRAARRPGSVRRGGCVRADGPSWSSRRSRRGRPASRDRDRARARTRPRAGRLRPRVPARWPARSFLQLTPWRRKNSWIAEMAKASPRSAIRRSRNSASVTSGVSSTAAIGKSACAPIRPERPPRLGRRAAGAQASVHPPRRARDAYAETPGGGVARHPTLNRPDDPDAKVFGKALSHACRPPAPACSLDRRSKLRGIPNDSVRRGNALTAG